MIKSADGKVVLSGALVMSSVMQLLKQGQALIDRTPMAAEITFDLADVTDCDSSGLALLVAFMRYAKRQGKKTTYTQLTRKMRDIARVSGLDTVLQI